MTDLAHPDRLAKIAALRAQGQDPFPPRGVAATPIDELLKGLGTPEAPGPSSGREVTVAGRLLSLRDFGKLIFAPLVDRTGRIQIGMARDRLTAWWPERKLLDGGDLVGVTGELGHQKPSDPGRSPLAAKAVAVRRRRARLVDKETLSAALRRLVARKGCARSSAAACLPLGAT
jgi:lysyl-tRNA synthetase class II